MIRFRGSVTYTDGRDADAFDIGAIAQAKWEQYAAKNGISTADESAPMLHLSYIAYYATTRTAKAPPSFEAWSATVDDLTIDVDAVDPTPAEASDGP